MPSKRYDWNYIRKYVNNRFENGLPMDYVDISKKFGMTKSTISYRVNRDLDRNIIWKIKRNGKNEVKKVMSEEKHNNISSYDIVQKALDKSYVLISRVVEPREMEQISNAIVRLVECKKELEENENNTNSIDIPDNVKKIFRTWKTL